MPGEKIYKHYPLAFIIFFFFLYTSSHSYAVEKSNISIVENELYMASQLIFKQLAEMDADTVFTNIKTLEPDRYFNSVLLKYADSIGMFVFIDEITGGKTPFLDIKTDIKTSYAVYEEDDDSLYRRIEINYSGSIRTKAGRLLPLDVRNFIYEDKISGNSAVIHNETDFEFAKNTIPEQPETFWDDIAKPIAIIGAAAVTVFLLFTLRSN